MSSLLYRVKRRYTIIINDILRAIISIHRRDKSLIVYGGALDLFVDNAKHLFILNHSCLPEYRHVWLTRRECVVKHLSNLGFEVVRADSSKGRRLMYNAGMIIYDNRIDEFSSHILSAGAIRFELWHGVTKVKMIGAIYNDEPQPYTVPSQFQYKYQHPHIYGDYVLATSELLRNTMSAAFQIPAENVIIADQPRNHVLYMKPGALYSFIEKYEGAEGLRLYYELKNETNNKCIYMPTFRDADPNYIYKAIPDWNSFNRFLKEKNIVLYIKVHRVTPLPQRMLYSNIKILDNELDVYPLLPLFDRLITDYSSIMFDFALMHKPIIIYNYDFEMYTTTSRKVFKSFYDLLEKLSKANNIEQLKSLLAAEDYSINPFPLEETYDHPGDYARLFNFINAHLENQ